MSESAQTSGEVLYAFDLSLDALGRLMADLGEPAYRARQLYRWLYVSLATDFEQMTNFSKSLREGLGERLVLSHLGRWAHQRSANGQAEKVLFGLPDGETIEAVLMRYQQRLTACVSTQVGCAIGCPFCATGQSGFGRDLSPGEIVEQVIFFERAAQEGTTLQRGKAPAALERQLTNVVLMGMGEPLLNYEAVLEAIRRLAEPQGFGFSPRRVTISTVGIVPGILRLAAENLPARLAVSLHAPTDNLRDQLVPINRRYPLATLIDACRAYVEAAGRRVSFEYALIDEVNDKPTQARKLADLLDGLLCHVNLIPLNPTTGAPYVGSSRERALAFASVLKRQGIPVSVRLRRGLDIEAGCGQLRRRNRVESSH